jgi:glycosyltransferase involved in cell wall biosynthesis
MRIGVLGHNFCLWYGGIDFLRLVTESLLVASTASDVCLVVPIKGTRYSTRLVARSLRDQFLGKKANYPSTTEILEEVKSFHPLLKIHLVDAGPRALGHACHTAGIDVLLPSAYVQPYSLRTPWIGYLADFQHKHLPSLFSKSSSATRDRDFARMLTNASTIIVNSRAVASDAERFFPGHSARVFSLPFGAGVPREEPKSFDTLAGLYKIESRYFIVSNQFWIHKDHATAFRAIAKLNRTHPDLVLVCTGEPSDPRDSGYFRSLGVLIKELNIEDRVKILGVVPKAHQLGLLQNSICLVQPTLSEGGPGGGSVFDAVGLGVRSLVSDIAVNLELTDRSVSFFVAGDSDDLVRGMLKVLEEPYTRPSGLDLRNAAIARRQACGQVLLAAASHALSAKARLRST